jgi:hypothetical protein
VCINANAAPTIRSLTTASRPVRPVCCSFLYTRSTSMNYTSASLARTPAPSGRGERASAKHSEQTPPATRWHSICAHSPEPQKAAPGRGIAALPRRSVPSGQVLGLDLSGAMADAARRWANARQLSNVRFERMDAEILALPDASVDACLCAFGLMCMPGRERAVREMRA